MNGTRMSYRSQFHCGGLGSPLNRKQRFGHIYTQTRRKTATTSILLRKGKKWVDTAAWARSEGPHSETPASVSPKQKIRSSISIENATKNDTWGVLKLVAKEKLNPIALNMNNFIVARDKEPVSGQVVGAGQLKYIGKDAYELSSIVVDDSYRGQGIGGAIVRQILDAKVPDTMHAQIFLLTVEDRQGFYARFGFQKATRAPTLLSLEKMVGSIVARVVAHQELVIMVLSLSQRMNNKTKE